ncbi:PREDICTED: PRUPE_8G074700 [Prunus dulcis]|uniref:PREDICTED: PRUPE_8G074700 n=1 Tax=Prunus dulcis TaxID=3755 RepID=A0A5E4F1P3_PRUDU|nr:PREDICTED: PRUPE_8G074700 [Prunus dulcis]
MVKVYEEYDSQGEEEEDGLNRKMVLVSKSLMVQIKYRIDDLPEWLLQNKLERPCRLIWLPCQESSAACWLPLSPLLCWTHTR